MVATAVVREARPPCPASVLQMLLASGIVASLWYVAMNVFVPRAWDGYRMASQVVSELSAVDAPTRAIWVQLGLAYGVLSTAFALGVWCAAGGNRRLRLIGVLLLVNGAMNLAPWPPMHQRAVLAAGGHSLTDTLHIVWSMAAVLLMLLAMGSSLPVFGRRFRAYTVTSLVVLVVCGGLTGLDAPRLQAGLPTPLVGVWERINIGAYMLWVMVLAVALLRQQGRGSLRPA